MLRRLVLICLELLVAVVLVAAAALFWASYYIDTAEFRSTFTQTLSTATGREVLLDGDININLWPEILLEVNGLTVGENPAFGNESFARFETIHVNVRVLPLFAHKLFVESVFVDGLELAIIANEQGVFNVESFLTSGENSADRAVSFLPGDWEFGLSNIEIVNTGIVFRDHRDGKLWKLSGISLRTGQIGSDGPVPVTVGSVFSSKAQHIRAELALTGLVSFNSGLSDLRLDDATVTATVTGDFLPEETEPGQLTSKVSFDWENSKVALENFQAQFMNLRAEGNLQTGDLSKALWAEGHVTIRPFVPAGILSRFAPDMPVESVDGLKSSAFASFFHVDEAGFKLNKMVATLDDITVRGDLGMAGFSNPVFDFNLWGSTVDLDLYLPLFHTGTPFVWGDFNLPLFRAFKGHGSIRADGLKIMGTLLSDIRLKITADDAIVIDAGAIKEGLASVGGTVQAVIGTDKKTGVPTFSAKARLDAESQRDGFAFLQGEKAAFSGIGTIGVNMAVPRILCPPEERSLSIANHLTGGVDLWLFDGLGRIKGQSGKSYEFPYEEANLKVEVQPGNGPGKFWNPVVSASLRLLGGTDVETLSAEAQGPISLAWDKYHVTTSSMSVNGSASVAALPKGARRVNASARIAYNSEINTAGIEDGFLRVLETAMTFRGAASGLNDVVEGSGEFAVRGADPKRIIYLLTGEDFPTEDPEALRNWSLESRFIAGENGFTLNDVKGDIDGLPITGQVVGNGYVNPMLSFSLTGGKLDIDRYLPPDAELTLEEKRTGKHVKAPPVKLPLEFLGALRLNGKAVLEELKLAKIRARGVTGNIKADNGMIHVAKVLGTSYDGALTADWTGEIGREFLTTHLVLHVEDMQAGPLTRDLGNRDYVRGLADVDIDLESRGATDDDILRNLAGKLHARVTNGSFKFSGYPKEGEIAPATMSKQEVAKMKQRAKARTSFAKAVARFTGTSGVFTADKFRLEAPPVLQSYGEGSFNLPENSIDFSIRNDFVVIPSVTLELTGKLTDPKVTVPTGRIVNDTVFNILNIPKKSIEFLRDLF